MSNWGREGLEEEGMERGERKDEGGAFARWKCGWDGMEEVGWGDL